MVLLWNEHLGLGSGLLNRVGQARVCLCFFADVGEICAELMRRGLMVDEMQTSETWRFIKVLQKEINKESISCYV